MHAEATFSTIPHAYLCTPLKRVISSIQDNLERQWYLLAVTWQGYKTLPFPKSQISRIRFYSCLFDLLLSKYLVGYPQHWLLLLWVSPTPSLALSCTRNTSPRTRFQKLRDLEFGRALYVVASSSLASSSFSHVYPHTVSLCHVELPD